VFKYIVADTHFEHKNILKYEPSRLIKAKEHKSNNIDRLIIDNWNKRVTTDDTVLHLGDVAFKDGYKMAKILQGNITLLVGNHDTQEHINFYKKLGWNIIDTIIIDLDESIKQSALEHINIFYDEEILNHKLLNCIVTQINNKKVLFSHFPLFNDNPYDKKYKMITNVLEDLFVYLECDINIHGHTHSKAAKEGFCKSACLELNGFEVINILRWI